MSNNTYAKNHKKALNLISDINSSLDKIEDFLKKKKIVGSKNSKGLKRKKKK